MRSASVSPAFWEDIQPAAAAATCPLLQSTLWRVPAWRAYAAAASPATIQAESAVSTNPNAAASGALRLHSRARPVTSAVFQPWRKPLRHAEKERYSSAISLSVTTQTMVIKRAEKSSLKRSAHRTGTLYKCCIRRSEPERFPYEILLDILQS